MPLIPKDHFSYAVHNFDETNIINRVFLMGIRGSAPSTGSFAFGALPIIKKNTLFVSMINNDQITIITSDGKSSTF